MSVLFYILLYVFFHLVLPVTPCLSFATVQRKTWRFGSKIPGGYKAGKQWRSGPSGARAQVLSPPPRLLLWKWCLHRTDSRACSFIFHLPPNPEEFIYLHGLNCVIICSCLQHLYFSPHISPALDLYFQMPNRFLSLDVVLAPEI